MYESICLFSLKTQKSKIELDGSIEFVEIHFAGVYWERFTQVAIGIDVDMYRFFFE